MYGVQPSAGAGGRILGNGRDVVRSDARVYWDPLSGRYEPDDGEVDMRPMIREGIDKPNRYAPTAEDRAAATWRHRNRAMTAEQWAEYQDRAVLRRDGEEVSRDPALTEPRAVSDARIRHQIALDMLRRTRPKAEVRDGPVPLQSGMDPAQSALQKEYERLAAVPKPTGLTRPAEIDAKPSYGRHNRLIKGGEIEMGPQPKPVSDGRRKIMKSTEIAVDGAPTGATSAVPGVRPRHGALGALRPAVNGAPTAVTKDGVRVKTAADAAVAPSAAGSRVPLRAPRAPTMDAPGAATIMVGLNSIWAPLAFAPPPSPITIEMAKRASADEQTRLAASVLHGAPAAAAGPGALADASVGTMRETGWVHRPAPDARAGFAVDGAPSSTLVAGAAQPRAGRPPRVDAFAKNPADTHAAPFRALGARNADVVAGSRLVSVAAARAARNLALAPSAAQDLKPETVKGPKLTAVFGVQALSKAPAVRAGPVPSHGGSMPVTMTTTNGIGHALTADVLRRATSKSTEYKFAKQLEASGAPQISVRDVVATLRAGRAGTQTSESGFASRLAAGSAITNLAADAAAPGALEATSTQLAREPGRLASCGGADIAGAPKAAPGAAAALMGVEARSGLVPGRAVLGAEVTGSGGSSRARTIAGDRAVHGSDETRAAPGFPAPASVQPAYGRIPRAVERGASTSSGSLHNLLEGRAATGSSGAVGDAIAAHRSRRRAADTSTASGAAVSARVEDSRALRPKKTVVAVRPHVPTAHIGDDDDDSFE